MRATGGAVLKEDDLPLPRGALGDRKPQFEETGEDLPVPTGALVGPKNQLLKKEGEDDDL